MSVLVLCLGLPPSSPFLSVSAGLLPPLLYAQTLQLKSEKHTAPRRPKQ